MRYAILAALVLGIFVSPELQAKSSNNKKNKTSNNDVYRKRLIIANEKLEELIAKKEAMKLETSRRDLQEKIDTLKRAIRRYELRLGSSKSTKDKSKDKDK